MKFFSILTMAASATAAILKPKDTPSEDYIWQITKWQAGESHDNPTAPTTGWFRFNVSGPDYGEGSTHIPPFDAFCTGNADGNPLSSNLTTCSLDKVSGASDASVLARVLPVPEGRAHIAITYLFYPHNQTDTMREFAVVVVEDWARARPPHDFTVKPKEDA